MSRSGTIRLSWILVFTLFVGAAPSRANPNHETEYSYRYVPLFDVEPPPGIDPFFDPRAIRENGRIYGNAYAFEGDLLVPYVASYRNGNITVLQPGFAYVANQRGTLGGSQLLDFENFIEQAALFRGEELELIPRQPGELTSWVTALSESDLAIVTSLDVDFNETLLLYEDGEATPLDFGPRVVNPSFLAINKRGVICGTTFIQGLGYRGFRHDTRTGETTLLDPLPTEPHSWAQDINEKGDVLGYSFVNGAIERIGIWDRRGKFKTYFVEGTPQVPTISNTVLFNEKDLIVITRTTQASGFSSYLVPKPGLRLSLDADRVEGLPADGFPLWLVVDVNKKGDLVGTGLSTGGFLLERIGDDDR